MFWVGEVSTAAYCTHCIGVGEVPGVSQPAAEMVVGASPVRQQTEQTVTLTAHHLTPDKNAMKPHAQSDGVV
jgi:hypothetical protein